MSERIICFFLEPTNSARRSYRRFVTSDKSKCPDESGYHNAVVDIGDEPLSLDAEYDGARSIADDKERSDPRWPKACSCGYEFGEADERQVVIERLYTRSDDGTLTTQRSAPVGAMFYSDWYIGSNYAWPREDGHVVSVRTPAGDWCIDSRASNGPQDAPGWTRTGAPPKVTARASILMDFRSYGGRYYHGFLTDGVLESC